jgi:hypothetical protein
MKAQNKTYSENNGSDIVIKSSSANSLLVSLRSTRLLRQNESSTDPNSRSTKHQSRSNGLTVEQTTGSNNLYRSTSERALVPLHELGNGWNKHGGGDITSVTTTFTTLGADDVGAEFEALLDVFGVSDHVHVENAGLVELLNDVLGWNTDGTDEEFGSALNNDINKLVELSLGVIMAASKN